MTTVSDIYLRVGRELVDTNHRLWSKDALLDYLNDAISAITVIRPDLARVVETVVVPANSDRVTVSADAYKLLSVNHADGMALMYASIEELNRNYPAWRQVMSDLPENWARDEFDELSFYLFPVPNQDIAVEYAYAKVVKLTNEADEVPLPSVYDGMLFDYIVYRAYSRDGQNESEQSKANAHYQAFQLALTGKAQGDTVKSPKGNYQQ